MDRKDFYFRQPVSEGELDGAFDDVEDALATLKQAVGLVGIGAGGQLVQAAPTANLTVTSAGPMIGYDADGNRIKFTPDQVVDMSVDEASAATAVVGPANERQLSIFVLHDRVLSDTRLDGNGSPLFFERDDSFQIVVAAGAEAPLGTSAPPALRSDHLLLGDVTIIFGQTQILNADISLARKQWTFRSPAGEVVAGTVPDAIDALELAKVSKTEPDTIEALKSFGAGGAILGTLARALGDVLMSDERDATAGPALLLSLPAGASAGARRIRVYSGNVSFRNGIFLTLNAAWNHVTDQWEADGTGEARSIMLLDTTYKFAINEKTGILAAGEAWDHNGTGWNEAFEEHRMESNPTYSRLTMVNDGRIFLGGTQPGVGGTVETATLSRGNIPAAWGVVTSETNGADTSSIINGFRVSGSSIVGSNLRITFSTPMANADYAVMLTGDAPSGPVFLWTVDDKQTTHFDIQCRNTNTNVQVSLGGQDEHVSFCVFGDH